MAKRIGLTMRVSGAERYTEWRDCLAQDWPVFMAQVFPEVQWVPVPNLGDGVIPYARSWALEGFILTGGNDVGENPLRDKTEGTLLNFALRNRFPIFGVCRGLQLIQKFFGGDLRPCARSKHVSVVHPIRVTDSSRMSREGEEIRQVNSFHSQAVAFEALASPLQAFAITEDGWAEGIYHREVPWAAVQWHPERGQPCVAEDRRLMRRIFGLEEKA